MIRPATAPRSMVIAAMDEPTKGGPGSVTQALLQKAQQSHRGAIWVELAAGLPIFLLLIFVFLSLASYLEARITLRSAVIDGARLALSRANPRVTPLALFSYNDTSAAYPATNFLKIYNMLVSGHQRAATPDIDAAITDSGFGALSTAGGGLGANGIAEIPAFYTAIPAYIYERMRLSLGTAVRTPCNPGAADGAGCVRCSFYSNNNRPSMNPTLTVAAVKAAPFPDVLRLTCYYKPERSILGLFFRLLRLSRSDSADFERSILSYSINQITYW